MEEDPDRIQIYLRLFGKRPFPFDPKKIIEQVNSPSLHMTYAAMNALALLKQDDVRALFERQNNNPEWAFLSVMLATHNYRDGDHYLIEQIVDQENELDQLHDLCSEITDVYKENHIPEALNPLVLAYEKNPCSYCRSHIVELLADLGLVPDWMIEECIYDADEKTRLLAMELQAANGGSI